LRDVAQTHVDGEFPEIRVELTRKTQTCCDTGHDNGDEVIKIAISRGGKLQGAEVNVVKRLVINAKCLIRVFHELVDRKRSIIRLENIIFLRCSIEV
jgi:hypothetical protein